MSTLTERKPMTPGRARVYEAVVAHFREHGRMPTVREVAEDCGFSGPNHAQGVLRWLVEAGYLERGPESTSRPYRLVDEPADARRSPEDLEPARGLTAQQERILGLIVEGWCSGSPPTYREIREVMGFASPHGVQVHVDALVRKGCVFRMGSHRSARSLVPRKRPASLNSGGAS